MNRYNLMELETINESMKNLPVAVEYDVVAFPRDREAGLGIAVDKKKAIMVNGKCVAVLSKGYKTTQHAEAFHPIREGLALRNVNYQYSLWSTDRLAKFAVYVGEANDGVKFGFRCINSFDGSSAIHFGFSAHRKIEELKIVEKNHVLVWGYRQTCSNGMIMKIPLKTCKYLDAEKVTRIQTLLGIRSRIVHTGKVEEKLEAVQYTVEAFTLLKNPLDMMIMDAQNTQITAEMAQEMIGKYVTRRKMDKYLEAFGHEEKTLWGLYNALTAMASHDEGLTERKREKMLERASTMLEEELMIEA